MDRLAQFGVSKSFGMEVEKLLALVHHLLEKGRAAHFEISFHLVDLGERKDKCLAAGDALNCEEALVKARQSIATEFETIIELNTIVYQGCSVDNRVLAAEVLHDSLLAGSL